MKLFLLAILLIISISLESAVIQLPLVLLLLFIFTIIFQSVWILPIGFASGIVLDGLLFRTFGSSSLYFILFLFLVFLYERKFELRSVWFVIMMSAAGSLGFMIIFGYQVLLVQLLTSILLALTLFIIFNYLYPLPPTDTVSTWKK